MTVRLNTQIIGIKEAVRELGKIDKQARRQLTKDYREIVAPAVNTAKTLTPTEPPLSGMRYNWKPNGIRSIFPYENNAVDRTMKPYISTKKPRQFRGFTSYLATFGVRWSSPAAQVIEMSGKGNVPTKSGQQMVRALSQRYGLPGRFLWNAYTAHARNIEINMQKLIDDVARQVNRKLK